MTRELEHSSVWPLGGLPPYSNPSPEECPRGPTDRPTLCQLFITSKTQQFPASSSRPTNYGIMLYFFFHLGGMCCFSAAAPSSLRLVFYSQDCFFSFSLSSCCTMGGQQHDGRPRLFLKPFVFWSATVYYGCLSVKLRRGCLLGESLMWMTFSHFVLREKNGFDSKIWDLWFEKCGLTKELSEEKWEFNPWLLHIYLDA